MDHLLNIMKEFKKFRETGNLKHLYKNELDKACFAHNAAYPDSKELVKRTISDKVLNDRAYEIARNRVYKFFDMKKRSRINVNKQLPKELHKPVTKKFKRRKVCAKFKVNNWAADLTEMGSFSSKNKNVKYLLFFIDVFTKYAWVKPLKDKKGKTVLNAFLEIVNESNHKLSRLWVEQRRECYNKLT